MDRDGKSPSVNTAKTETTTSIKSRKSKCLSLLFNGDRGDKESLAAAGGRGRSSEGEGASEGSKMGQCVWLLEGCPVGWGRGTGSPVEVPAAH